MIPKIEISTLSINRLKNSHDDFVKYQIDVSLDEVENSESEIKLKYKFVLLSNPNNTKISVEGLVSIPGNEIETSKQLEPDERNTPMIVNTVYQEIFPLIYIISKTMQIPCPAHKLSQLSSAQQSETKQEEMSKIQEPAQNESMEEPPVPEIKDSQPESPFESLNEEIIQEANVSSI
jgi:hypothetical protein